MAQSNRMVTLPEAFAAFNLMIDIQPFTGSIHEDPIRWIDEFALKTRFWKEESQLEQIVFYLQRTAKFWFTDELEACNKTSFIQFRKAFIARFVGQDYRTNAIKKLKAMKLNLQENSVSNFVTDFRHFYKEVYPSASEEDMIHEIFDRFPTELRSKILQQSKLSSFSTLNELKMVAERSEASVKLDNESMGKLFAAKQTMADDTLKELVQEMKALKTQLAAISSIQSKKSQKKKCFKCSGDWPNCGCTQKCRKCQGQWPKCPCFTKAKEEPKANLN